MTGLILDNETSSGDTSLSTDDGVGITLHAGLGGTTGNLLLRAEGTVSVSGGEDFHVSGGDITLGGVTPTYWLNSIQSGAKLAIDGSDNITLVSDNNGNISITPAGTGETLISKPKLTDYSVTHTAPTISTGAVTFDCETSNSFAVTLTENITAITLSNPPASGTYGQIRIRLTQDVTGGRTVAGWPAAVKWAGGSAPTITATASASDVVILETDDGGTTWLANVAQDYS